jgi:crotonobetainyl-CoA:carnitine CoA-transferase CaiB-like acyl-CoA transferase
MAALFPKSVADVSYRGIDMIRGGRGPRGYHPAANYRCADGFVSLLPLSDAKSLVLLELAGHPEAVTDSRFTSNPARLANYAEYDALIAPWLAGNSRDQIVSKCQAHGIPSGSIQTVQEYLNDRQPAARRFFCAAKDESGRTFRTPGLPDGREKSEGTRSVPALGEHTRAVLTEVAGFDDEVVAELMAAGVVA